MKINEFDSCERFIEALGWKKVLTNKTVRDYWKIGDVEMVLVKILEPAKLSYFEIEGKTNEKIIKVRNLL